MEDNLKYIVYLTINIKNSKIYVGVHGTKTPYEFDGYIGEGVFISRPSTYKRPKYPFHYAVKKYGPKNFKRLTLYVCDTLQEALELEAKIVNEEFIKRRDVYNATIGGGMPPNCEVEIYQYDISGNFIKMWDSAVKAGRFLNISDSSIRSAVRNKRTSAGYLWTDVYFEQLNVSEYNCWEQHDFVYKFNDNNELVEKFESVKDAAKNVNSTPRLIFNAISARTKSKGFYYSYDPNFKIDLGVYDKLTTIYLYNLDGTFFKEFSSPKECIKYFGHEKTSRLYSALRTGGLYNGYQISKEKVAFMKNVSQNNSPKKVAQYDQDGNLIKIWDTVQSAFLEFGPGVKKCITGRQNKTKGFIFKYTD